jgi:hypothetical protein
MKSETLSLTPAKVVNRADEQVRYNTAPISATIHVAFPDFLPGDPDRTAPLMLMVQPSVTTMLTETFVHLTIQADKYPLIVQDPAGMTLSQPLLVPINGEAIFYRLKAPSAPYTHTSSPKTPNPSKSPQVKATSPPYTHTSTPKTPNLAKPPQVKAPSKGYTIHVKSTWHGRAQPLVHSNAIKVRGKVWGGVFKVLQLLGNVISLPVLIGSLFGYATQVRKEMQSQRERETQLITQNNKIREFISQGNYQEAWRIYKVAREKYKELLINVTRKGADLELDPLMYVHVEHFETFINIWYEEDSTASNILDALLWAHHNLGESTDQMLLSLLRKRLKIWQEVWSEGDPDAEIIKWIQISFSTNELNELLFKVKEKEIMKENDLLDLKNEIVAPPGYEITLNDFGIHLKEDVFGFGFSKYFYPVDWNEQLMERQPFLVIGPRGTGKTTLALWASLQMLKNKSQKNDDLSLFPCYAEHLPTSGTGDKILQWLLGVVAYRIFMFLINNPDYWIETPTQKQSCVAWLLHQAHTPADIANHPMARTFSTKMLLKSVLSYAERRAPSDRQGSEDLDFHLGIIGNACPAPFKGLALLVDPAPLSWKQSNCRQILGVLADRAELLAKHNIFLKLFVPEKTPELHQNWTFEQETLSWSTEELSEMLEKRTNKPGEASGKFGETTWKRLALSVSTPRQLFCLAKAWNEVADDMLSCSEEQINSWIQQTMRSRCDI